MQNMIYLILLAGCTSAFVTIQNPGSDTDHETSRTDSLLYPLILNPFQVSHWNCFGTTLYHNTAVSSDYTYSVDVCVTGLIAAKLLFPLFYSVHTGHSLLADLGFIDSEDVSDEYGAPAAEGYAAPSVDEYGAPSAEGYAAPSVDEYGAPAYQDLQESYGAPQPVYGAHNQRRNGKNPSFRERLSIAYKDLSKAIKKNNPLNSYQ